MILAALIAIQACNSGQTGKQPASAAASLTALTEQNMLDKQSVLAFATEGLGKNKQADKIFLQAIETYRNKKDAASSLKHFKASILLAPQAKSYYEFGNALFDMKQYADAAAAYDIAESLGYKPLSKLFYNTACAYALQEKRDSAMHYLVVAIEFGYTNTKQLFKDKDLSALREEYDFESVVQLALSGAGDPERLN